ncbi:MAG: histidine phosphatase family protein [Bacteroidetes bacterium]|nr:histidine phosphatase family protein [Bacteroidota bacterium]
MKTLILIRHAKASLPQHGQRDVERKLAEEGREIVQFLKNKMVNPDLILCSHAVRAHETATILAKGLGYPHHQIITEKKMYSSHEELLMEIITSTPDSVGTLMMIGHNPEITGLSNYFLNDEIESLPTTGVVSVSFITDYWNEIILSKKIENFILNPNSP